MMNILSYFYNYFRYRRLLKIIWNKSTEVSIDYLLSKDIPNNSKIVLYGFGPYGAITFIDLFKKNKIIEIVDGNINLEPIKSPKIIPHLSFDYIVITVMNMKARAEIFSFLEKSCVSKNKIVWVLYNEQIEVFRN